MYLFYIGPLPIRLKTKTSPALSCLTFNTSCGKLSAMRRSLLGVGLAILLLASPPIVRADTPPELGEATQDLLAALADLGVTVSLALAQELGKAGERLAKEHLEGEAWRGPGIDPEEYVGGFNLKLYPKGKSRSDEHLKAETYYRLDRNGLKEFEFNASRP
jgi:hypothetical protein